MTWRTPRFGPPTLVASDVDGTLIDDANRVGRYTRQVLTRVAAAGVPFIIATGRPPRWIAEVAEQLPVVHYAVCANGAIVYDIVDDRVLYSATLGVDVLPTLAELSVSVLGADAGLAAERVGATAHDTATPAFVAAPGYEHAWLNPDHVEVTDAELFAEPATKLLVRKTGTSSGEMAALVAPLVGDLADVTFSTDDGLIELSAPGVTKATGLAVLAEIHGLPMDAVIAFGDMPNDVPLLSSAQWGVAVAGAHPAALAAANEIAVSNNEDAVGRTLHRWF